MHWGLLLPSAQDDLRIFLSDSVSQLVERASFLESGGCNSPQSQAAGVVCLLSSRERQAVPAARVADFETKIFARDCEIHRPQKLEETAMKIFLDTGNLDEIQRASEFGVANDKNSCE